jgi:hypothetical protein
MSTSIGMSVDRSMACNGATEGSGLARAGSMGARLTEVVMQATKPKPVSLTAEKPWSVPYYLPERGSYAMYQAGPL